MLNLDPVTGLGLLAIGSSPGGGGSNVFAVLLDLDLELSLTMSSLTTLAAMGELSLAFLTVSGDQQAESNYEKESTL